MNTQPKSKILILLIGILLAANIVLLCFFLFNKKEDKRPERKSPMTTYLKNEIGFSPEQMVKYDTIKTQQRAQMKKLFDELRSNKESQFKALGISRFSDSAITAAATFSATRQMDAEVMMLQHLKAIREICTPAQQAKFDTGFYKAMVRPRPDDKPKN